MKAHVASEQGNKMNLALFTNLHQQSSPLLICNVWDAASAKVAEQLNFKAIGTSSAALANVLGYNDGEEMTFEELLFMVERIAKATQLPLSVDIESGFSDDPVEVAKNIKQLVEAGVVGINIEDSKVEQERKLLDATDFSKFLSQVRTELDKEEVAVFINVRTDPFLLGVDNALAETTKRVALYTSAGANGLFVPCITDKEDIQTVTSCTNLPVNVMCMPNLPNFKELSELGVKRISMGNFLFDRLQDELQSFLQRVEQSNSFAPIF